MAKFNLFMRQWLRGDAHCTVEDIDEAVEKGLLTVEQGKEIKGTERTL